MEEVKKKQRVGYFDALRIVAAVAVIVIHIASLKWNSYDVGSSGWQIANILNAVTRWAVPIFVMISGALLSDPKKPFSTRKFFRKNVLRIVIVFLVWSAFYVLYSWKVKKWEPGSILGLVALWIEGHYHMWFLYMLLGLYIITPILRLITSNRKILNYSLLVGLIFTFIIPGIVSLANVATLGGDNVVAGTIKAILDSVMGSMHFSFLGSFVTYYLLGYYLRTEDFGRLQRVIMYLFGLIGAIVGCLIMNNTSEATGVKFGYNSEFLPWILAMAVAVFVFFRYHCDRIGRRKSVRLLASTSFGIYLVHVAVLDLIMRIDFFQTAEFGWLMYLLVVVVVAVISFVVTWVLQRIPIVRKIVL